MEHVSHFNKKMVFHSKDEALMCKIFLSSLGPMVMRWFNGLRVNSIDSFKKLTQSFGARFITCRQGSIAFRIFAVYVHARGRNFKGLLR